MAFPSNATNSFETAYRKIDIVQGIHSNNCKVIWNMNEITSWQIFRFRSFSFLRVSKACPARRSPVWAPLSNNNFVPLRALKMAVLSYYYFGEKTNDGALTLRGEERQSQGSQYTHALYVCHVRCGCVTRMQDPRSTFGVKNIAVHLTCSSVPVLSNPIMLLLCCAKT